MFVLFSNVLDHPVEKEIRLEDGIRVEFDNSAFKNRQYIFMARLLKEVISREGPIVYGSYSAAKRAMDMLYKAGHLNKISKVSFIVKLEPSEHWQLSKGPVRKVTWDWQGGNFPQAKFIAYKDDYYERWCEMEAISRQRQAEKLADTSSDAYSTTASFNSSLAGDECKSGEGLVAHVQTCLFAYKRQQVEKEKFTAMQALAFSSCRPKSDSRLATGRFIHKGRRLILPAICPS